MATTSIAELQNIVAQIGITQREAQRELLEMQREGQKMQRAIQDLKITAEETSRLVGGLGNSMGELTEWALLPGLNHEINKHHRHNFTMMVHRKRFLKAGGGSLAEVDMMLEDCNEVMIVEVKSQFSPKWVDKLLQRIDLLRKNEKTTGLVGKTIFAAVAGIRFSSAVREIAEEYGIYLIEISEDYRSDRINVIAPPEEKLGRW